MNMMNYYMGAYSNSGSYGNSSQYGNYQNYNYNYREENPSSQRN